MNAHAQILTVSILLKRLSQYTDMLAGEVHQIEHAIGEEILAPNQQSAQTLVRLQRLDFVRQSLEDLALLLLLTSEHANGSLPGETVEQVKLDATKALFRRAPSSLTRNLQKDSIGDFDLF